MLVTVNISLHTGFFPYLMQSKNFVALIVYALATYIAHIELCFDIHLNVQSLNNLLKRGWHLEIINGIIGDHWPVIQNILNL